MDTSTSTPVISAALTNMSRFIGSPEVIASVYLLEEAINVNPGQEDAVYEQEDSDGWYVGQGQIFIAEFVAHQDGVHPWYHHYQEHEYARAGTEKAGDEIHEREAVGMDIGEDHLHVPEERVADHVCYEV